MSEMVRKQIYLETRQVRAIRQRAAVLGMNESELIRQAIDRTLYGSEGASTRPDPAAWLEIEHFVTAQAGKPLAGEPYHFDRVELYNEPPRRFHGTDPD
jgi:hypothetical protein